MCQLGSFFCKLFFLDLQYVDLGPLADPREVAALLLLDSDQEAGALSKHTMTICTVHLHNLFMPKLSAVGRTGRAAFGPLPPAPPAGDPGVDLEEFLRWALALKIFIPDLDSIASYRRTGGRATRRIDDDSSLSMVRFISLTPIWANTNFPTGYQAGSGAPKPWEFAGFNSVK